jgi:predicted PurR-regulated permease PerM
MPGTPSKFDRLPQTLASVRDFNASKAILLFLIGGLLYIGRIAFVPVALALLLSLVLSLPVEALKRIHVPRMLSALLILLVIGALAAGLVAMMWTPAQDWYASAPKTLALIQHKVTPVARIMNHLEELSARAGSVGTTSRPVTSAAVPAATGPNMPSAVLGWLRDSAIGAATVIMVTLFLLTGGPPMVARMTAAFFDHLKANHVQHYIEKVRAEVAHYYVLTALINLALGIATALTMFAWGMPTPYLWGALAAILSFVPYAGSAITLLTLTVVAIVSFDGLGHAAGVAATYAVLAAVEGQIAQPLLVGRRLEVNPLLIFLGLWFGGFFWGVAGIILATPILVALKVVAQTAVDGKSMMEFLGPNKDPSADAQPSPPPVVAQTFVAAIQDGLPSVCHPPP